MFESCRAHLRVPTADLEGYLVEHLNANVTECKTGDGARHAADDFVSFADLVPGSRRFDLEHAQPPIHLASVALTCDRLLSRITTLGEADVRLVETRFRGQDAIVD